MRSIWALYAIIKFLGLLLAMFVLETTLFATGQGLMTKGTNKREGSSDI